MGRTSESDILVKSKNGFTFKRKCKEDINDKPLQRVKKESDRINEKEQPIKIILKDTNPSKESKTKPAEIPQKQEDKKIKVQKVDPDKNKNKENQPLKPILKDKEKEKEKENKPVNKEPVIKEIQLRKASAPREETPSPKKVANVEKSVVKLPPYPVYFLPIEFELEVYEKENPYKRLTLMVTDICSKEKAMLSVEYKDFTLFLGIGIKINNSNFL